MGDPGGGDPMQGGEIEVAAVDRGEVEEDGVKGCHPELLSKEAKRAREMQPVVSGWMIIPRVRGCSGPKRRRLSVSVCRRCR
jgi:hypothetical protein